MWWPVKGILLAAIISKALLRDAIAPSLSRSKRAYHSGRSRDMTQWSWSADMAARIRGPTVPSTGSAMPVRAALFHRLGSPVMIGAPRKSFIDWLHRDVGVTERLPGSLAAVLTALQQGVQLIRVHDVAATAQAISIWRAVRDSA